MRCARFDPPEFSKNNKKILSLSLSELWGGQVSDNFGKVPKGTPFGTFSTLKKKSSFLQWGSLGGT